MAFFIARAGYADDSTSTPGRAEVEVILTDPDGRLAVLWSLELAQNASLAGTTDLRLFNENPPAGNRAQPIAKVPPHDIHSGLVLARLSSDTFPQLPATRALAEPRATFGTCLKNLLDQMSGGGPDQSTLSAIASAMARHLPALQSSPSLSAFILNLTEEQPAANLDASTDVRKVMRSRTSLFKELERLVLERRMVFLVGGLYSYLQDFLNGFRGYLESGKVDHVQVDFQPEVFTTIRRKFPGDSSFRVLDSFLASVAYKALEELRRHAAASKVGIFKAKMVGKPVDFARAYLQTADSHAEYWHCVRHFMQVIDQATEDVHPHPHVTIFLPFKEIDRIVNGKLEGREQIWEGMDALQNQLSQDESNRSGLGIIFAANTIPVKELQPKVVQNALLRLPPLSRDELSRLLFSTLGQYPPIDCLDTLDQQTGGAPFFVSLVLKISLALLREPGSKREPTAVVADACNLVRTLLSPESKGQIVSTRVPPEVQAEINEYRRQLVEILGRSKITLNTSQILTAWQHPQSQQGETFGLGRGIDEQLRAFLDSGLMWIQASGEERGSSLHSLREYPEFRFCPAGELPLELGNLMIKTINNPLEGRI